MNSPLVAVLGSINLDLTVSVDELPRPGQTVLGGHALRGLGGKGANQAAATAQLLGHCRMLGAVGKDADGDWLLDKLAGFGVDVSAVCRDEDHTSGLALIGVDRHGENSIIVSPGANAHVVASSAAAADADALMLQFEIPLETVRHATEQFDGFVAVNPSPTRPIPLDLLHRVDLFVVNADEYTALPELTDAQLVAVTLGAQGAELRQRGRLIERIDAIPVAHPASTVGAGDAFFAALTCALISAISYHTALRVACVVAASAVASPGSQPRLADLDDTLRTVSL